MIDQTEEFGGVWYTVGKDNKYKVFNELDAKQQAINAANASRTEVPVYKNTRSIIGHACPTNAEFKEA